VAKFCAGIDHTEKGALTSIRLQNRLQNQAKHHGTRPVKSSICLRCLLEKRNAPAHTQAFARFHTKPSACARPDPADNCLRHCLTYPNATRQPCQPVQDIKAIARRISSSTAGGFDTRPDAGSGLASTGLAACGRPGQIGRRNIFQIRVPCLNRHHYDEQKPASTMPQKPIR